MRFIFYPMNLIHSFLQGVFIIILIIMGGYIYETLNAKKLSNHLLFQGGEQQVLSELWDKGFVTVNGKLMFEGETIETSKNLAVYIECLQSKEFCEGVFLDRRISNNEGKFWKYEFPITRWDNSRIEFIEGAGCTQTTYYIDRATKRAYGTRVTVNNKGICDVIIDDTLRFNIATTKDYSKHDYTETYNKDDYRFYGGIILSIFVMFFVFNSLLLGRYCFRNRQVTPTMINQFQIKEHGLRNLSIITLLYIVLLYVSYFCIESIIDFAKENESLHYANFINDILDSKYFIIILIALLIILLSLIYSLIYGIIKREKP